MLSLQHDQVVMPRSHQIKSMVTPSPSQDMKKHSSSRNSNIVTSMDQRDVDPLPIENIEQSGVGDEDF